MKTLGIDCHSFGEQRTGVLSYLVNLVDALGHQEEAADYLDQLDIFLKAPLDEQALTDLGIKPGKIPLYQRIVPGKRLWTSVHLPKYLAAQSLRRQKLPDAMLYPAHVLPYYAPGKSLVTVHDVAFELFPDYFTKEDLRRLTLTTRRSAKQADQLLAVSEATKRDLVNIYSVPEEKITVTPLAAEWNHFKPASKAAIEKVRRQYKLERPYILGVGTLQKRKNHARLVEAVRILVDKGIDVDLVLSGGKGWLYEETLSAVERSGLGERVKFLGYVPYEDLPALYSGAVVSALVSLYEGFGIPVLESLGCGTPVVTANTSSFPEVGGKAAIMVDQLQPEAIAQALQSVITDTTVRNRLVQAIPDQIARYSWDRTAQTTLSAVKKVL